MEKSKPFTRLKALRVEQGLNQSEMANLIGLNVDTYRKKENGLRQFTLEEVYKIKEKFDIDLQYYFFYNFSNQTVTKEGQPA